jgi:hypothetical protein
MKTVFSSHELAHIWISQTQPHGRCAANMKFEGKDFYSYRTVIARILDDGSVAVAQDRYSITTSNHQSYVRQAVSHKKIHYIARIVCPDELRRICARECAFYYEKAAVAVKKRDDYLALAYSISKALNEYLDAIKDPGERMPIDQTVDLETIKAAVKAQKAEALAKQKERERIAALSAKELIDAWLDGGAYDYRIRSAGVLLRVKNNNVETTQGASVPLSDALKMHDIIKTAKTDSQLRRLHGFTIGNYTVNDCTKEKIVIGCHVIPMSEISRIAAQLGVAA